MRNFRRHTPNVHESKRHVQSFASGGTTRELFISVMSFGLIGCYGGRYCVGCSVPNPLCRCLRPQTGLDEAVQTYVRKEETQIFLNFLSHRSTLPAYERGQSHRSCHWLHRREISSVSLAERIASSHPRGEIRNSHRDLGRELELFYALCPTRSGLQVQQR